MKVNISRELKQGNYIVHIQVSGFSDEEQEKIAKFGSPQISFTPKTVSYLGHSAESIPIHAINHYFGFADDLQATKFVEDIKLRLKVAIDALKRKEDNFSKTEEYEL